MSVKRRSLVAGSVLAAGGLAAGAMLWPARSSAAPRALAIPPLMDARSQGQALALTAQAGTSTFFAGRASATLGYNGSYLGPTLRVYRGDDVQVQVRNALQEATSVHWHGLLVPGELDGGPHQTIAPGGTWKPVLPIRQPAATLWYHAHTHGRTAQQVYSGLAGLLIVTDEAEQALALPRDYGVDDLPLVLQDRQFQDGILTLPQSMMDRMHGSRGDTFVVNGTVNPVASVPRRLVRLRLVNGCNARALTLAFSDERVFDWIASEGGLLEKPVPLQLLRLSPGERAEILVDFSDGQPVSLVTEADRNAPMMARVASAAQRAGSGRLPIMAFEPLAGQARAAVVPQHLVASQRMDPALAVRRRLFAMNMHMPGMMRQRGSMFGINGRAFDMQRIDVHAKLGDIEIWVVSGDMMEHPFHVHGVHFEVLRRNGAAPDVRDQGLRDTVVVQQSVELLVQFTQTAVSHPFMYHCHILEHEDNGMMGQFLVHPPSANAV